MIINLLYERIVSMGTVMEQDICAHFIGMTANHDNLSRLCPGSRYGEYIIRNSKCASDPKLRELFGITERLKEQWEYSAVDFNLHLTLDGDIIVKAYLDKYRETGGGHGRPIVRPLKETQQELRVARRILQYITK